MALEDGQAGVITELAPQPFDDLVALLRDDPSSDIATDAPGRQPSSLDSTDLAPQDHPEDLPDLMNDEDIGNLDPDRSLSPNASRAPLANRAKGTANAAQQGQTFKVTVKGDDGADQTIEVDEKERGAGYLRHAQFTKLTQELAVQRAHVVELADNKIQTSHQTALQAVQRASAVVSRLAGFMTPAEMHKLAIENPQAYQVEKARVDAVQAEIKALDDEAAAIIASSQNETEQRLAASYAACWAELERLRGIRADQPEGQAKLKRTFEQVIAHYGIPAARFAQINDPKLIDLMFDAVELLDLKARAAEVVKPQVEKARRMPAQRQHQPRESTVNRELDGRFASRRGGSREDLARWIANNQL